MEPTYLSLRDLMGKDFPAPTWLVDQLIPAGATTVISAAPGSYKTWLLFETALAVARGGLLFGKFKTLQGGVLVLDGESGERQLKDRLVKLGASEDLQISFLDCERFVVNEKSMDTLLADCIRLNAKFVIVDTLVTVHSADENSPGDMTEIFKQFKRLAKVGIAVVVAHHNRKSGTKVGSAGDEMRGSSGILASVDCHIGVSRRKGSRTVTLEQTKNRFAEELKPFRLLLTGNTKKSETLAFEYVG
jgi:RecA-family ATPase